MIRNQYSHLMSQIAEHKPEGRQKKPTPTSHTPKHPQQISAARPNQEAGADGQKKGDWVSALTQGWGAFPDSGLRIQTTAPPDLVLEAECELVGDFLVEKNKRDGQTRELPLAVIDPANSLENQAKSIRTNADAAELRRRVNTLTENAVANSKALLKDVETCRREVTKTLEALLQAQRNAKIREEAEREALERRVGQMERVLEKTKQKIPLSK